MAYGIYTMEDLDILEKRVSKWEKLVTLHRLYQVMNDTSDRILELEAKLSVTLYEAEQGVDSEFNINTVDAHIRELKTLMRDMRVYHAKVKNLCKALKHEDMEGK